jgi:hypothetical protein
MSRKILLLSLLLTIGVSKRARDVLAAQRAAPLPHNITVYTFTFERELACFLHEDLDTYKLRMIENPRYRHAVSYQLFELFSLPGVP